MATSAYGFWDPLAPAPKDPFAMTPAEHAALLLAPKKPAPTPSGPGTTVTVRAYPVPESKNHFDHMYEEYDDGHAQYIYSCAFGLATLAVHPRTGDPGPRESRLR
jgi:hypothetical protein